MLKERNIDKLQFRQRSKELSLFLLFFALQALFAQHLHPKPFVEKDFLKAVKSLRQRVLMSNRAKRPMYNLIPLLDEASENFIKLKDYKNAIWLQKEALHIEKSYSSTARQSERCFRLADLYLLAGEFDHFLLFMETMLVDLVGPGSPVDGNVIYQKMIDECKKRGLVEKQISLMEERYRWRKSSRYKGETNTREFEAQQHAILAAELIQLNKTKKAAKAIQVAESITGMTTPQTCSEPGFLGVYLKALGYYEAIRDSRKVNFINERIWELEHKKPSFTRYSAGKIQGHRLLIAGYKEIPPLCVHRNCLFILSPFDKINGRTTSLLAVYDLSTHKMLWQYEIFTRATACVQMGVDGDHLALLLPEALQVFHIKSGQEVWRRHVRSNYGSLCVTKGNVIFCHHRPRNWAYDSTDILSCFSLAKGEFRWRRKTTGPCFSEMSVDNKNLFVTIAAKKLLALTLKDCKPHWQRSGSFVSAPFLWKNKLYTTTEDKLSNHTFELPTLIDSKSGKVEYKSNNLSFMTKHFLRENIVKNTLNRAKEAHKEQLRKRRELLKRLKKEVLAFPKRKSLGKCRQVLLKRIADYERRGNSLFLCSLDIPHRRNLHNASIKGLRSAIKKIPSQDVTARDIQETACALIRLQAGEHKRLRQALLKLKEISRTINAIIKVARPKPLPAKKKRSQAKVARNTRKPAANIFLMPEWLRDTRSILRLSKIKLTRPAPTDFGLAYTSGNTIKHFTWDLKQMTWIKVIRGTNNALRSLTQPSYAKGCVFVCTSDGRLLAFDDKNGQEKLQLKLGEPITHRPHVDAKSKHIVIVSDFGSVFHLDMSSVMRP